MTAEEESAGTRTGREAFREFVLAHGAHLLRVAFLLTGDRSSAEDLRQDVLEGLYVAWPRVQDPFSYARTAMTRRAVNRWRLRGRRGETALAGDWLRPVPDPAQAIVDRSALVQALAQLPPRQRAVLVLRYFEDLTEADAAAVLGCSVGTVKSQSSRALAKLRDLMPSFGQLPAAGQPPPRRQPSAAADPSADEPADRPARSRTNEIPDDTRTPALERATSGGS